MNKNINKYKVKESNINKLKEYLQKNQRDTGSSFGYDKGVVNK